MRTIKVLALLVLALAGYEVYDEISATRAYFSGRPAPARSHAGEDVAPLEGDCFATSDGSATTCTQARWTIEGSALTSSGTVTTGTWPGSGTPVTGGIVAYTSWRTMPPSIPAAPVVK